MATLLYRLGRTAYRRWPLLLVGWLVAILAIGGFAAAKSQPLSSTFSISGIPSLQAAETQKELFPNATAADQQVSGQVVVQAPQGRTLAEEPFASQLDALAHRLNGMPQLTPGTTLVSPVRLAPLQRQQLVQASVRQGVPEGVAEANAAAVSPLSNDGRAGVISWTFDVDGSQQVQATTKEFVRAAAEQASANGLTVVAGGQGMEAALEPGITSEVVGIAIALVVLVLTFGSLVAAGLPILGAVVGLTLGMLAIFAATAFTDLNQTTPALASMIGLAVGIDYALFILSGYRGELRHTDDRAHAMGRALGTAGSAVVFAGLTVVIALVALTFSGINLLATMGVAAAGTVVAAVLVALTFLPAVLGLLKGKAFAAQVRSDHETDEADHEAVNASVRLGQSIRKAPLLVALVVAAGLAVLAVPVTQLHLGLPSDATAAVGSAARTSADIVADGWGAGRNAPMVAVVDARQVSGGPQQQAAALGQVVQWAGSDRDVANAQVVQVTQTGNGGVVLITPRTGPDDKATDELLQRLRDGQAGVEQATGASIGITGQTAIQADISDVPLRALPVYLAIVVGLAFVLLVLVFRSLVVPLLATGGFLLSILATLGVTVSLVQDGRFGLFDPQPVMSVMPTLLIGIVFGLAMDYQVFLTTRMREAYVHGMDARDAVIDGFRHSGRVVTAAALIMISVFAAFAFQENALIKTIGIGLATAVLLDAFLVRMVLLPAVMLMLRERAWWIPRWLDRVVPSVDVEGERLSKEPQPIHGGPHRAVTTPVSRDEQSAAAESMPAGKSG